MKKMVVSLICILFMFSVVLSGCGAKNEATPTETPAAVATATPAVEATAVPEEKNINDEAFTIRLGAWFIDDRTFMKEFKSNVETKYKEKYPNATVQWDILLGATYFDKIKAELASDTAPDVFFSQNVLGSFVDAGYLTDLSDQPWAANLHPGAKPATTYKGKVYAGALGLGATGVWYNKKIFNDLGLTAPKTWDEFVQILDKIKAVGIIPIGLGFKDAWTAQLFYEHMGQSVYYGTDKDYAKKIYDGSIKLDSPEIQSVLNRFQLMTEKGYFNKTALSIDWPQSAELFTSGKSAMIVQGSWMPGVAEDNFTKLGHAKFDVGYLPVPDDKGYVNLAVGAGESLSVNAKSKLQQQSKDLISVILSEEVLAPFSIGNGSIPAISGMKVAYTNPALNELLDAISKAESNISFASYIAASAEGSIVETVTKTVSGAKFNSKDLQDAVDKMEKDKATIILPAE